MSPRVRWAGFYGTMALYLAAMGLPFSHLIRGQPAFGVASGWRFVRFGVRERFSPSVFVQPWDFIDSVVRLSWLANPLIWLTILAFILDRFRLALLSSLLALPLSLFTLADFAPMVMFQPGYWVWVSSAATGLVCWLYTRRISTDLVADYGPVPSFKP